MRSINLRSANLDKIDAGPLSVKWSARGDRILRYYIDIRHRTMNLHRELGAPELFILQSKVDALLADWDAKLIAFETKRLFQTGKGAAEDLTAEAIRSQEQLANILTHTLHVDDSINWESLKDGSSYPMPRAFPVARPTTESVPEPMYEEPAVGLWDVLLGRKRALIEEAESRNAQAVAAWRQSEILRKAAHAAQVENWEEREAQFWAEHHGKKAAFEAEQAASHEKVDALRDAVAQGQPDAVIEHASLVLENSDYGGLFEKSFEVQYRPEARLLLLAYGLPAPDRLPQTKAVRYVKATGELVETKISERDRKNNFESACYQICLRTLHELFEADVNANLDAILFNGIVEAVDPATGLERRSCIMSVLAKRDDFCRIDLGRVDPKVCFKALKGVSAASLAALAPVPPVVEMDREDRRFIDARDVGSTLDHTTNLASISWEDFEHLVRELFEKEFLTRGGEVKVTQSSSDGGVDAIAFDPDPISGGKIVIQAKRYTRTVGVAAVRDLYGTVMNEGASKGILVTTADYGPDAYRFASDKPLTLLNGANLLHLLQRHGYEAQIDLVGARAARPSN
ncbi:restriction endonuclease [Sphingomonas sp. 3-13AW]|uniref:restriction endonuclease n=1 Tax=Sphingomonas sp. 3-13AW TaxID=3050450 RepID=UPI003BB662F3